MEIDNIIRLPHFYSQTQYAIAGGLSQNTAGNRLRAGLLASIKIDGRWFIDITQSPPTKRYTGHEKKPHPPARLPLGVDKNRLVHLKYYADKKGRPTPRVFYDAILTGKIFGLVIGGEVFMYKDEALKLSAAS